MIKELEGRGAEKVEKLDHVFSLFQKSKIADLKSYKEVSKVLYYVVTLIFWLFLCMIISIFEVVSIW